MLLEATFSLGVANQDRHTPRSIMNHRSEEALLEAEGGAYKRTVNRNHNRPPFRNPRSFSNRDTLGDSYIAGRGRKENLYIPKPIVLEMGQGLPNPLL